MFHLEHKKIKIGTKNDVLGKFRIKFEKTIVIFEISTIDLVNMQSFLLKKKLNLGTKFPCLSIFGENLKKLLSYLESAPFNFSKSKVSCKTKNFDIVAKIALFCKF